ncbi:phospholipase [Gandjariella thermophila]|nr:phospholipase [Gandjariella thermophila]
MVLTAGSAQAALSPVKLDAVTDTYLFHTSLPRFVTIRSTHPYADQLDWSSDGCSHVPDSPFGFHFRHACERHDFGYRNYRRQRRFTEPNRREIDDNFRSDMYSVCGTNWTCRRTADLYYVGVRELGGRVPSTADAITAVLHR